MNDIKDMKVYFASPWFNAEQAEREERVKGKLREIGFDVWSPKENCVVAPFAEKETRSRVFQENCNNIESCDVLFAITDGKDMGTIWEAGYACGYNERHRLAGYEPIKIVYYCETLGNGQFNLMLAESGDIVITNFEDLDKLPELIQKDEDLAYAGAVE